MRPASAACQSMPSSSRKKNHINDSKEHIRKLNKTKQNKTEDTHLLGNLEPGLLEAKDGAAVEGGGDLEHSVVVVETATDVGHSHPLLYDQHSSDHVLAAQDLGGYEVAYLALEGEAQMCFHADFDDQDVTGLFSESIHH